MNPTWSLTPSGIRTVFVLETRQRLRSRWWIVMLGVWVAVLALLTLLVHLTVVSNDGLGAAGGEAGGALMFGIVTYLVLGLGGLISPALSATSINGDRSAGVLAAIQSTLLSPAEIVVGKLLAAWSSALAFLVLGLPFLIWAYLVGGTRLGRLLVVVALTALTLLVVCAIGLGCSALLGRTAASTATTYLLVIGLGLGLPILFGLSLVTVSGQERVTVIQTAPSVTDTGDVPSAECETVTAVETVSHTERTWWLLAPSPFVVVADAAPVKASLRDEDPLAAVRDGVREARLGPSGVRRYCGNDSEYTSDRAERLRAADRLPLVWPFGLAADLAVGLAFTVVAVRRLRVPAAKLPRGTRVA